MSDGEATVSEPHGDPGQSQPGKRVLINEILTLQLLITAVVGGHTGGSASLATIADTSVMWVLVDVPERDVVALRMGQPVEVRVAGVPGRSFAGTLTWIASEVDERTRTVRARAELGNPDGAVGVQDA